VLSSEGSAGELQMDDMPGDCWIGWWSVVRNHIFPTVWFQREQGEAGQSVAIMGHVFSSMMKLVVENGTKAGI
jgi:hypothetical protein